MSLSKSDDIQQKKLSSQIKDKEHRFPLMALSNMNYFSPNDEVEGEDTYPKTALTKKEKNLPLKLEDKENIHPSRIITKGAKNQNNLISSEGECPYQDGRERHDLEHEEIADILTEEPASSSEETTIIEKTKIFIVLAHTLFPEIELERYYELEAEQKNISTEGILSGVSMLERKLIFDVLSSTLSPIIDIEEHLDRGSEHAFGHLNGSLPSDSEERYDLEHEEIADILTKEPASSSEIMCIERKNLFIALTHTLFPEIELEFIQKRYELEADEKNFSTEEILSGISIFEKGSIFKVLTNALFPEIVIEEPDDKGSPYVFGDLQGSLVSDAEEPDEKQRFEQAFGDLFERKGSLPLDAKGTNILEKGSLIDRIICRFFPEIDTEEISILEKGRVFEILTNALFPGRDTEGCYETESGHTFAHLQDLFSHFEEMNILKGKIGDILKNTLFTRTNVEEFCSCEDDERATISTENQASIHDEFCSCEDEERAAISAENQASIHDGSSMSKKEQQFIILSRLLSPEHAMEGFNMSQREEIFFILSRLLFPDIEIKGELTLLK